MSFFEFPNTRTYDKDLGWLIKRVIELNETLKNFVVLNTIKYADPIQWDIATQYPTNTIVIDGNTGIAYISAQPVPSGVSINNTDFWSKIFDLSMIIGTINSNLTDHDDGGNITATFNSSIGDWLLWNDTLYRVIAPITIGTAYAVGSNIEQKSVEDFFNILTAAINIVITDMGDLADLNTIDKSSIVNAINELVTGENTIINNIGDLSDLNTSDKSSIVNAINEALTLVSSTPTIFVYPESYGAKGDGVTDDSQAIEDCCTFARYNGYGVAFRGVTYACERAIELTGNFIIGVPNRSTIKYTGTANIPEANGAFVTRTGYDRGLTFGIVVDCSNNADIALDANYGSYGASIQHRFEKVWVEYYDKIGFNCPARAEDYMINCGTTPTGHANSDGLCAGVFMDYGGPIVLQDCNFTGGYIRLGAQYAQLINCITVGVHVAEANSPNDISFIGGYCHNDRLYGGNVTVESTTRLRALSFIGTYIQNDEAGMKAVFGGTGSWDATQITLIGCHFLDTIATPTTINMLAVNVPSPTYADGCAISLQGCFFPSGIFNQNVPSSGWRYDNINSRNLSYINHLADLTIFPHFLQQRNMFKYFCSPSVSVNASGNTVVTVPFLRNTATGIFFLMSTTGDFYIGAHSINAGTIGTLTDIFASGTLKARFGGGTGTQALVIENTSADTKTAYVGFIGLTYTS